MKLKFGRIEIGLFYWDFPFNLFSKEIRPKEYGAYIALGYLFEFWVCYDFNKYDNKGYLERDII